MAAFSSEGAVAESAVSAFTRSRAAFDLKGVMTSLTVVRLKSRDLNLIERQLRAKVTQFPQFFQDAPVVLDVAELEGGLEGFALAALVRALHVCRVVPVAITNIDEPYRPVARAAGLGVVTLSAARPAGDPDPGAAQAAQATRAGTPEPERHDPPSERVTPQPIRTPTPTSTPAVSERATPHPVRSAHSQPASPTATTLGAPAPASGTRPTLVIRQPVRSGQVVYAERSDLVVLAPVNPGAQLIADGNIHVYSTLRGRAVAGAKGFSEARIFCQKLEAELIAISGAYVTSEDIPQNRRGVPVQAFLERGNCVIAPL